MAQVFVGAFHNRPATRRAHAAPSSIAASSTTAPRRGKRLLGILGKLAVIMALRPGAALAIEQYVDWQYEDLQDQNDDGADQVDDAAADATTE